MDEATSPETESAKDARRPVPAIVRAIQILDHIAREGPQGISELSRDLGLPKSSTHGLCQTLADLGAAVRLNDNQFGIGPHVLQWAAAFQQQSSLTVEFERLSVTTPILKDESLNLSVLSGTSVLYVACKAGRRPLGVNFAVGMSFPAAFTATGKAMMSTMTDKELDALLNGAVWPRRLTSRSVRDRAELETELAEVREQGYSIEKGQLREGMLCVGAPVFGPGGSAVAGLAVGMLAAEATPRLVKRIAADLKILSLQLSSRIGGFVSNSTG